LHGICFNCGKTKTTRSITQNDRISVIFSNENTNKKEQSVSIIKLQEIGFQKAGCWVQKSENIDFELEERFVKCSPVLYAFIIDGLIKYVGETTKTLQNRMQQYKTPAPTQSTNIKNRENIKKELEFGNSVEIYVFVDSGLLSYGGYKINLARGLEKSIIDDLNPEWND
jgi:hypothetical protein